MSVPERDPLLRFFEVLRSARRFAPLVGGVLLLAAIVVVLSSGTTLDAVRTSLAAAPGDRIALLLLSVLASVVLSGWLFHLLTNRFGHVGFIEMQSLMAATTLANYLPLRPGLLGRVLWHKRRNDIRARDALRTILEAALLTALSLAVMVPTILVARAANLPLGLALAAPAIIAAALLVKRSFRPLVLAWLIRYAETLLTGLRYHIAFELVGSPVAAETSLAIACVSMVASLVPLVSNGLGLREWAVGLLAPVLAGATLDEGLAAELINRAAEVLVVIPTGLLGAWWLWRRAAGRSSPTK